MLNGFSAHADKKDLIAFAEGAREQGDLHNIALVHGEPQAQAVLQQELAARKFQNVVVPKQGDRMRF